MRRVVSAILAMLFIVAFIIPSNAQTIPKTIQDTSPDSALRERKNAWTVGLVGGLFNGTYMRFADEIAKALDDGENMRVLPIVSYGAAGNLEDLLYLRGVDVGITQSDVFEYFRTERKTPNLEKRIHYIVRLPVSEIHVIAQTATRSLEDLRGKKVSFGPMGTGASLTGTIIFQRLGIQVEQLFLDDPTAMGKLRTGEIAAVIRSVGKPIEPLAKMPPNSGLHFVSVPFTKQFADYYTLGELTHQDYPTMIAPGQTVDTIAVPAVLAVFNWQKSTNPDRHKKVERFVEQLFTKFSRLQQPPFHAKWKDINLNATVPGWTRYAPAEQMLQKMGGPAPEARDDQMKQDFQGFLVSQRRNPKSAAEREVLFREFIQWRDRQSAR